MMNNMKLLLGLLLATSVLTSCGPSREELEAREKFMSDSIQALGIDTTLVKVSDGKVGYYYASDFGLVPGKVIRWMPNDDEVIEAGFERDDDYEVYIHILQSDGSVKVMKSTKYAWRNLYTGDVLR
jgi:hypothetical protein